MRDKHYRVKGYRLSEDTILGIEKLATTLNKSYNQLFEELIKQYDKETTKTIG